jgi:hypothetical protein
MTALGSTANSECLVSVASPFYHILLLPYLEAVFELRNAVYFRCRLIFAFLPEDPTAASLASV